MFPPKKLFFLLKINHFFLSPSHSTFLLANYDFNKKVQNAIIKEVLHQWINTKQLPNEHL